MALPRIRTPGIVGRAGDAEAGGHFAQALDGFHPLGDPGRHAPDGGRPRGPLPARAKAPTDEDDNDMKWRRCGARAVRDERSP